MRRPDPIRYENFKCIQVGMEHRQVVELLGCSPGVYGGKDTFTSCCPGIGRTVQIWESRKGAIMVFYAWSDERVESASMELVGSDQVDITR